MFKVIDITFGVSNEYILCTCDTYEEAQDALFRYHDELWMETGRSPQLLIEPSK